MKIGRNVPCPCGSGCKYKGCCLDKDHYENQLQGDNGQEAHKFRVQGVSGFIDL